MNTHLKCMFFNANGIRHRYDDIMKFTNENLLDLVFVVESHLKDNNSSLSYLHSSLPAFSGDSGGLIGGIAVLCRNSDVRRGLKLISASKTNLWLILQLDDQLIAVCYFPPSCSFRPQMMALMKELERLSDNWTLNVTIVGDFNARAKWIGDHLNTPRGAVLKEIIQEFPVELYKPERGQFTTINTMGGKGITDLVFQTRSNCSNLQVHELES
jgi:exonuclease III